MARTIADPKPPAAAPGEAAAGAAAPRAAAAEGATPPRRGARLLGDDEKAKLGDDVVFTVDGLPVTKDELDTAFHYLKSYRLTDADDVLKQTAVMELVKLKAAEAASPKGVREARDRILAAQRRLKEDPNLDFATLASEVSDCPSKTQGGDLGYFSRDAMDFSFSRVSFGLQSGEVSEPVQSIFGYHLIKLTGLEKGDTPAEDRVRASHILASYTQDQGQIRQVSYRATSGQVDLAFASDEYRQHAPDVFK
jgi:hypothetical protein